MPFAMGRCQAHRLGCPFTFQRDRPMKHPLALALAVALAAAAPACASPANAKAHTSHPSVTRSQQHANPFLAESPLPLHYPQFDKIKDSDFAPAFDRGMAEQLQGNRRHRQRPGGADVRQHDRRDGELGPAADARAATVFFNLVSAEHQRRRCDKIEADVSRRSSPRTATPSTSTRSSSRASRRCTTSAPQLGPRPAGAALVETLPRISCAPARSCPTPTRTKLKAMNGELATLQTKFRQNVLAEANDVGRGRRHAATSSPASPTSRSAPLPTPRRSASSTASSLIALQSTPPASRRWRCCRTARCASASIEASVARGSHGGQYDNRDDRRRADASCAPNARSCWATRTTPPTRSPTRPRRRRRR